MNFIALWIRLIWLVIWCMLGIVVVFLVLKSYSKIVKGIVSSVIVIVFGVGCFEVLKSINSPDIKNFTGTYIDEIYTMSGMGPMMSQHCFEANGEEKYVDIDVISERILSSEPLEEGAVYEIYYEASQDLIISIEKTKSRGRLSVK